MHSTIVSELVDQARPATAYASHGLVGVATVPGDKSISHRALMLSGMVMGKVEIHGLLEGEDVMRTAEAMRRMGCGVEQHAAGHWSVTGVGVGGLAESDDVLDMGNSGTSTRLLMGLVTPYPHRSFFTGDASLRRRPMKRVVTPLEAMGARIYARGDGLLPLLLEGTSMPMPIEYRLPVASAQVKSAILLAALATPGVTTVVEPTPSRDHTEHMLKAFGVAVDVLPEGTGGRRIQLKGQQDFKHPGRPLMVPADPSSAAFVAVAALITPGSVVMLPNVGMNPLRAGLFQTLQEMGAKIHSSNQREASGELVADMEVTASHLKAVDVPAERAPSMIDEYPILAVAAAFAEGTSRFFGLNELTVKESNRLKAIIHGLRACGVAVETGVEDGEHWLAITGNGTEGVPGGGQIAAELDHRIAMSFLVLGLASERPVTVDDVRPVDTSFPGFIELMQRLGAKMELDERAEASTHVVALPQRQLCIAIDGPAASGKGTLARRLASYFGLAYLDTGRLYRAVGLRLLNRNLDPSDEEAAVRAARELHEDDLINPRLRQENVGNAASIVSASPMVRQALLEYQQRFARRAGGSILDGRDIGTVVCPNADIKFYVTASVEARARRRFKEIEGFEAETDYETVLQELRQRDERDQQRAVAPLKPARDAIIMDTSDMDATEVFSRVVEMIESYLLKKDR